MRNDLIGVILQARTRSTRMPRKIMKKILGKPVLIHDLERIKKMETINKIIVATTTRTEDDVIVGTVEDYDTEICIFRGSEHDVLDRYYKAAKKNKINIIVRITSDCPLVDPKVSDLVVEIFIRNKCDYCCNNMPRTFPHGLDTEVFSFKTLERSWEKAKTAYEREHVSPYMRRNSDEFKLLNVKNITDLSSLRWTLDYPEDFKFITEIYKRLYQKGKVFYMEDVLKELNKEPWLVEINRKYVEDQNTDLANETQANIDVEYTKRSINSIR